VATSTGAEQPLARDIFSRERMGVTVAVPNGDDFAKKLYANDPALIARIKAGEGPETADFYAWLYRILPNLLMRKFGFNNYDTARDFTADLVAHIWQQLRLYDPQKGRLIAWIYVVIRHRVISAQNAAKAAEAQHQIYAYEIEIRELIARRYPNYETAILSSVRLEDAEELSPDARLIREIIDLTLEGSGAGLRPAGRKKDKSTLKEEDLSILLLIEAFNDIKEAARIEGITVEAAKKRRQRATGRLRKKFEETKRTPHEG
jgi:DNA-directed RNA polymerase specialized sigma24 family protein